MADRSLLAGEVASPPFSRLKMFLTLFLSGIVFCLSRIEQARQFVGVVDDRMRALQIEHLIFGGGRWWDMTLPMISMPALYISPWSRVVDAPYVVLTLMLAPMLGQENALLLAFNIWPPMMFAIFCVQVTAIYRAIGLPVFPSPYLVLVIAVNLMTGAIWEFVPGRIDHHNMQIIALMAIFHGLVRWDRAGGVLIGVGSLLSVAVALEGLPFVVVAFAGLVCAFLLGVRGVSEVLKAASIAIVAPCVPLALVLLGPSGLLSTQCDAFSAPYIYLLVGLGSVLFCATTFMPRSSFSLKLVVMALPAIALASGFAILFDQCLAGPYWMIDPVSKSYWLDHVTQEFGVLQLLALGRPGTLAAAFVLGVILICATASLWGPLREKKVAITIMLTVAWSSLFLTLMLSRYVRFAYAFVALFLPLALQIFTSGEAGPAASALVRRSALICAAASLILSVWLFVTIPSKPATFDLADHLLEDDCEDADFSVMKNFPPGRIVASTGVSMELVFHLPPGFSVAAVPFHRGSSGMKRMYEAFFSTDEDVRTRALEPFDYIAVCRLPPGVSVGGAPFYSALSSGANWPGLWRLNANLQDRFQFFRIDHQKLR